MMTIHTLAGVAQWSLGSRSNAERWIAWTGATGGVDAGAGHAVAIRFAEKGGCWPFDHQFMEIEYGATI